MDQYHLAAISIDQYQSVSISINRFQSVSLMPDANQKNFNPINGLHFFSFFHLFGSLSEGKLSSSLPAKQKKEEQS